MRRYSIFLIVLGLSISTLSLHAQRGLGGHSLLLDDGQGHTVTITVPVPTSTYTWTLPSGVPPANMPGGTTNNSILRWDAGTTSWLEDVNILATAAGGLTTNGSANIGSAAADNNIFGNGANSDDFAHSAGNVAFGDGVTGLNHFGVGAATNYFGNGATTNYYGLAATTTTNNFGTTFGNGLTTVTNTFGNPVGGGTATNTFGTPTGSGTNTYLGLANFTGSVQAGSSAQFQVDNSGNVTTSGTATLNGKIIVPIEIDATSGTTATVSGNVSFAEVFGSDTGPQTLTITNATTGQLIMIYNNTQNGNTLTINGTSIPQYAIYTFIYLGAGWARVQ